MLTINQIEKLFIIGNNLLTNGRNRWNQ